MSDSQNNSTDQDESEGMKNLRSKAAKADAAEARAEAAERKAAFLEAGVPLTSKPAQALMASYSGEMTPEAIKAEAADWGLLGAASDAPPADEKRYGDDSPEVQQQNMRQGLDGAPAPDTPPQVGGVDQAMKNFEANRKGGMARDEATSFAFGEVIKAAAQGDAQATFDPNDWAKKQERHGHGAEYAR